MNTRIALAALAAILITAQPADARHKSAGSAPTGPQGGKVDVGAIPAYPMAGQVQPIRRASVAQRRKGILTDANGGPVAGRAVRGFKSVPSDRETVESRVERSALVRGINAKLARWVRPSGKCAFGQSEILTTYYNSGRRTANGERFYPGGLTAAHRTMAFGTTLRVTNPHTGRSATVRINDRGPFTNAKLDLAQGAARAIGMHTSLYLCAEW